MSDLHAQLTELEEGLPQVISVSESLCQDVERLQALETLEIEVSDCLQIQQVLDSKSQSVLCESDVDICLSGIEGLVPRVANVVTLFKQYSHDCNEQIRNFACSTRRLDSLFEESFQVPEADGCSQSDSFSDDALCH